MNLQQLSERCLAGVIFDFDHFGVVRSPTAHASIVGCRCCAPGIAGSYRRDATQLLEDGLDTPEATACKDGGLFHRLIRRRSVELRIWELSYRDSARIHELEY